MGLLCLIFSHLCCSQSLLDAVATDAEKQNSEEWLQTHSIAHRKLSLKDLVDKGKIGRYVFIILLGFRFLFVILLGFRFLHKKKKKVQTPLNPVIMN